MYQASGMTQQVRDIEVGMESESEVGIYCQSQRVFIQQ